MRHINKIIPICLAVLSMEAMCGTTWAQYNGSPTPAAMNPYYAQSVTDSVISDVAVSESPAPVSGGGYVTPANGTYTGEYTGEMGTSVGGFSTTPGYPRISAENPEAAYSPELATEYPKTREDLIPERVGQNPPLKPYDQQESFSYNTETSTSNSPTCQICGEGYGSPYLWQIEANAVVKHRQRLEDSDYVFSDYSGNTLVGLVNSNMSFPVTVGLDLGLTRYLGRNAFNYDIWMDMTFDGLYEWEESRSFVAQNSYNSGFGLAGLTTYTFDRDVETTDDAGTTTTETKSFTSACQLLDLEYESTMNTGEVIFQFRKRGRPDPLVCHPNGRWTRECQGGIRYTHMAGIRFTEYDENMRWSGTSNIYDESGNVLNPAEYAYGDARIETTNSLLGLSLGGEMIDKHCIWAWGFNWRVTPFLNFMENNIHASDSLGSSYRTSADETDVSYQVDLGIFTTYKIRPHFIVKVGYDISILGNLAQAGLSTTFDANGKAQVGGEEYLLFQGLKIGGTLVW